jgi:hypothetical protein
MRSGWVTLFGWLLVQRTDGVTIAQEQAAIEAVVGALRTNQRLIPAAVRLVFHDCFESGKCDGCLDFSDPGNNGLDTAVAALDDLLVTLGSPMSKADFYALAGTVAVREASKVGGSNPKPPGGKKTKTWKISSSR